MQLQIIELFVMQPLILPSCSLYEISFDSLFYNYSKYSDFFFAALSIYFNGQFSSFCYNMFHFVSFVCFAICFIIISSNDHMTILQHCAFPFEPSTYFLLMYTLSYGIQEIQLKTLKIEAQVKSPVKLKCIKN